MVSNGYLLSVDPANIYAYISQLREKVQKAADKEILHCLASEVQTLFDLKNLEMAKYPDKSILGFAEERVQSCIDAVQQGIIEDERFDFRSSIILIENDNHDGYYALFNSICPGLTKCFEEQPEVSSYKFYLTKPEKKVSEEENIKRGQFWHKLFTESGWNQRLIGINAQLTVQPVLDKMDIDTKILCSMIESKTARKHTYCRHYLITEQVKRMVGNMPVNKISPSELTRIYFTAFQYADSEEGKRAYEEIEKRVEKGFLNITPDLITLVDATVSGGGMNIENQKLN